MLGINRVTVYRLIREGKLPARRIGERALRITPADIEVFLSQRPSYEESE